MYCSKGNSLRQAGLLHRAVVVVFLIVLACGICHGRPEPDISAKAASHRELYNRHMGELAALRSVLRAVVPPSGPSGGGN
ncbi:hypothetical protein AXF42_Ash007679 [Apostasia shenzhenica]|uniref:Uncharacterized protein n=1 Tax=Apostasia shenzhenica TaxID=1088818 RepID=A0A2I0A661_9ASPA|nr:hypothetical protein AXF42_Ash007679 [Apostasia shenzhenica]